MNINYFRIFGFNQENFLDIKKEDIEKKYVDLQMKLMKNQINSDSEQYLTIDLLNKAFKEFSSEKHRIKHYFDLLEEEKLSKEKKINIEKNFENNFEIKEYFFNLNERIADLSSDISLYNSLYDQILNKKNEIICKMNYFLSKLNYEKLYESYLELNFIFRAIENLDYMKINR
jgi:hypothetical protein